MPCNNITELMRVVLDKSDRLVSYRFVKRTCGSGVGADSLMNDYFQGRNVHDLLDLDVDRFCDDNPTTDEVEEFLQLKHYFALQNVLAVLTGRTSGGRGEACVVSDVQCDDDELIIDTEIKVDLVADQIQACGRCSMCGTKEGLRRKVGRGFKV